MPTIYVKSDGKVLTPIRPVDEKALAKVPVGVPHKATITKPRNGQVHKLYFAAIKAAAKHWPEGEEPFSDEEDAGDESLLRAWLQVKAGYSIKRVFAADAAQELIALIGDVRGSGRYAFVKKTTVNGEPSAVAFVPLSIAYQELSDEQFEPIKEKVFALIESMLECSVQTLIENDANEV